MPTMNTTLPRRSAFTLVELVVVIGIILVIAALGAAFVPSVADSQNLTRSVDQLEQWLLTAKMRAKRDGLATGIRFVVDPANPGMFSEFQYIQQPDALTGGWLSATQTPSSVVFSAGPPPIFLNGGMAQTSTNNPLLQPGQVLFTNVDFTDGKILAGPGQFLVQAGDFLELRDGGVYQIAGVVTNPPALSGLALQLGILAPAPGPGVVQFSAAPPLFAAPNLYETSITLSSPTTNYRILRQARPLIGEPPLQLPNNMVVDTTANTVIQLTAGGNIDILFSPSGAVVGANAGNGKIYLYVHDSTQIPVNIDLASIVAVQCRTGFIGAYSVAPGLDPYVFAEEGRASGL